jgi:hypothetical protein
MFVPVATATPRPGSSSVDKLVEELYASAPHNSIQYTH